MKKTRQSIAVLLMSALFFAACSDEQTAKAPDKIADNIDVETEDVSVSEDSVALEPIKKEEPKIVPPPPVPRPMPRPMPPEPQPWPPYDPYEPRDPMPYPEPPLPPRMPEPKQIEDPVDFPDVAAEFPGGNDALKKFIGDNVNYPAIDLEAGNQGRVFIEFIVEKDGSMTGFKLMRGISETLNKEAMRVVRLMPKWKPAEANGQIVRSKMVVPIQFKLN